jgi:hypothetical protein
MTARERRDGAWRMIERIKRNRANVGSLTECAVCSGDCPLHDLNHAP